MEKSPKLAALVVAALTLCSAATASAVTGQVCVRNDGVGSFSGGDLALFADSDWDAGDRTGSGPGSALAPGSGTCMTMTGLYQWNGYQYQYVFNITFMDSTGLVTFQSPSNLQLTNASTWYISASGASNSSPSLLRTTSRSRTTLRRRSGA